MSIQIIAVCACAGIIVGVFLLPAGVQGWSLGGRNVLAKREREAVPLR